MSHTDDSNLSSAPEVKTFVDPRTSTMTYVVFDPESRDAILIDPVLDYEPSSARVFTESVDQARVFIKGQELRLHLILETHAHADHLSGAQALKKDFPDARTGIGENIRRVQKTFVRTFDLPEDFPTDGRQFDRLFSDGEIVEAGTLRFEVIYTPGHTEACNVYRFSDAIFTGDTLFMPDMGTARCDFPGGSAERLYDSIQRLYQLPDETRVFVGHDYGPGGRELAWETTLGEEKANNIQIAVGTSREDYVAARQKRDATLGAPQLLFQSVQVNIDAGHIPEAHDNKIRYLKIPINVFRPDSDGAIALEKVGRD
jgi:glyoxylase-like metal-dependent hydrolase (beta-lactamase superfamily II)